ncbi:proteasome assembly chaperone 3-like [Phymastichus coffea]|uniref:proteasome assembly chaperone 3-like n=1 Tax=Phymastichus coffea TaxID=108790 RepID=UPI00273AE77F|nr:proteasome assembly chaperone 3-like [Phymastichus coffea]
MLKSCGVIVNGNHTDIALNFYANRIFLVVSQYKKLGSLVTVRKEAALREFDNENTYSTKVIFGKDDPEIHAAARYITEQINADKPFLISICLKDYEVSTLRTIVKTIQKLDLKSP